MEAPNNFIKSVEKDPLFAANGMDIDNAFAVLRDLESLVAEVENIYSNTFFKKVFFTKYPLASWGHPFSFLEEFFKSEQLRREFLFEPSLVNGEKLLKQWTLTAKEYRKGVQRYQHMYKILESFCPPEEGTTFEDLTGNVFDLNDLKRVFKKYLQNSDLIDKQVLIYQQILNGEKPTDLNGIGELKIEILQPYKQSPVPPEMEKVTKIDERHFASRNTIVDEYGPFDYALSQFDGKLTTHQFKIYMYDCWGARRLKFAAADMAYFLPMKIEATGFNKSDTLHAPIKKLGIPYWYQPIVFPYMNLDNRYLADLATIVDLHRRPGLDQHAVMYQRSSLLDGLLGMCGHVTRTYLDIARARVQAKEYYYWYAFIMRTYSSIYFLPFNKSVYRLKEDLKFTSGKRNSETQYVSAKQIVNELDDATLETVMDGGRIRRSEWRKEWGMPQDKKL